MKIKLIILLATLAALTLWRCRWDLEELIFVEVFADFEKISEDGSQIVFSGRIEGLQEKETVTEYGFVWSTVGPAPFPGLDKEEIKAPSNNLDFPSGRFSSTIGADTLELDKDYYYWAYAATVAGIEISEPRKFNTGTITVTMEGFDSVRLSLYIFEGSLNGLAVNRIIQHGHLWSTEPDMDPIIARTELGKPLTSGPFLSVVNNLSPSTTYYVTAYADTGGDTLLQDANVQEFTTSGIEVKTTSLEQVNNSARAEGSIQLLTFLNDISGLTISNIVPTLPPRKYEAEYGFVWNMDSAGPPGFQDNKIMTDSGLQSDTTFSEIIIDNFIGSPDLKARAYVILTSTDGVYRDTFLGAVQAAEITPIFWEGLQGQAHFPGLARRHAVYFNLGNTAFVGLGHSDDEKFYAFDGGQWFTRDFSDDDNSPSARSGAIAFELNGSAYVGLGHQGDKNFYRFDGSSWETLALTDTLDSPSARSGAVAFVLNGFAYIGLGHQSDKNFYRFDGSSWETLDFSNDNNSPSARSGAIAFVLNGAAYVGLGDSADKNFYRFDGSSWEILDFSNDNNSPSARSGAVAFELNGAAYVALGASGSGFKTDLRKYDGSSWSLEDDSFPLYDNPDGRAFAVGFSLGSFGYIGTGESEDGPTASFYRFKIE